jgi:hypothetical protein
MNIEGIALSLTGTKQDYMELGIFLEDWGKEFPEQKQVLAGINLALAQAVFTAEYIPTVFTADYMTPVTQIIHQSTIEATWESVTVQGDEIMQSMKFLMGFGSLIVNEGKASNCLSDKCELLGVEFAATSDKDFDFKKEVEIIFGKDAA